MSEKQENKEWTNREVGALWLNVNQKTNEKYLTGQINGEKVIMFKNKYKDENPKAPDFRVYKQKDQGSIAASKETVQTEEKEEEEEEDLI
jgi:uncharacterized protein (DUF736 family)